MRPTRIRRWLLILAIMAFMVFSYWGALQESLQHTARRDGQVVLQTDQDYTLSELVEGDLALAGKNLLLQDAAQVNGDASLVGEAVTIDSVIGGKLSVAARTVTIEAGAIVNGDAQLVGQEQITINGTINGNLTLNTPRVQIGEDAIINGTINGCDLPSPLVANSYTCTFAFTAATVPARSIWLDLWIGVLLTAAAALLVTVFPQRVAAVEDAMRARAVSSGLVGAVIVALCSGGIGLCTALIGAWAGFALILGPVLLLLGVALSVLAVMGWTPFSFWLGSFILRSDQYPPMIVVLVGSAVAVAVSSIMNLIPLLNVVSGLSVLVVICVGVGAAANTRLGARPIRSARLVQG
jgi:hypothetical protein